MYIQLYIYITMLWIKLINRSLIQSNAVNIYLWTLNSDELILDKLFFENLHSKLEKTNWCLDITHETLTLLSINNTNIIETEGLIDLSLILSNIIDTYLAGLLATFSVWYRAARTNLFISFNIFVYSFVSKDQ